MQRCRRRFRPRDMWVYWILCHGFANWRGVGVNWLGYEIGELG